MPVKKKAMSNREKNKAYRQRRYDAGYKQMRIWVPRESEGSVERLERKMFVSRLQALTAGWSVAKLSKLLTQLLKFAKEKVKEGAGK